MSGRLPIHVNQENSATEQRYAGVPVNMTMFSERLRAEKGYATAHIGKWHCGQASNLHVPLGRGFEQSLSFFNFGEDHYTQVRGGNAAGFDDVAQQRPAGCRGVDLWLTANGHDGPAYGLNGTYGGYLFAAEAERVIREHDVSKPLFMFLAWQNNHPPLQVPREYVNRYPKGPLRTTINGMSAFLDESTRNVTSALRARGMWENTLLIFSGDNGGYLGNGGDDSPLRGGKFSDFDGGVRSPSFASGGLIPKSRRGSVLTGPSSYAHIADWSTTFLALAGVTDPQSDPRARAAGLPGLDGVDLWPMISGANVTSPRTEIPLSILPATPPRPSTRPELNSVFRDPRYFVGGEGIVMDGYKLLLGAQHFGPFDKPSKTHCINATNAGRNWTKHTPGVPCTCLANGCLFALEDDPTETVDLSARHPDIVARLRQRLESIRKTVYAPDRGVLEQAACAQIQTNKGYWGPWLKY